jgi:hypothetical protein
MRLITNPYDTSHCTLFDCKVALNKQAVMKTILIATDFSDAAHNAAL